MLADRRRKVVEKYLTPRTRGAGGGTRWYADFRAFRAVGGDREALVVPGHGRATRDREEAILLADARLLELEELERFVLPGLVDKRRIAVLGRAWLRHRAGLGKISGQWLRDCERHIRRAALSGRAGHSETVLQ